jgi:hypothetical protein
MINEHVTTNKNNLFLDVNRLTSLSTLNIFDDLVWSD